MNATKYGIALVALLLTGHSLLAQCLMTRDAFEGQMNTAARIVEGKVVAQQSFLGAQGNVYTSNQIEVYRVLKGQAQLSLDVVTEGGVVGDLMQVVSPSAQIQIGEYGVFVLSDDEQRSFSSLLSAFYPIDERTGAVYGTRGIETRERLYDAIAVYTGSETIQLLRLPESSLVTAPESERSELTISSFEPLQVTAGTKTVVTITGQGFGEQQGDGFVAFRNADDGGQSYVALASGPHYLSWTDTEIQLYVPSATLYNTAVAGTGTIRVVNQSGQSAETAEPLRVEFAKSEVIFSDAISNTVLVAMQNGGYRFNANHLLTGLLSTERISNSLLKWSCNTGANFSLDESTVSATTWSHDGVNLIGMSETGQLPSYLLGKTVTTFSGCGTPNGIQWNLIEVDIILNRDINWSTAVDGPTPGRFDLETVLLHEIGHAHLLQHNNESSSPMFFELTAGSMKRTLLSPSIEGGSFVSGQSAEADATCSEDIHQYFDPELCNLSVVNSVNEFEADELHVYPNPFNESLFVQVDQPTGFEVADVTGRTVLKGTVQSSTHPINTHELRAGLYTLILMQNGAVRSSKLVKN